jgi:hypothetical protein
VNLSGAEVRPYAIPSKYARRVDQYVLALTSGIRQGW